MRSLAVRWSSDTADSYWAKTPPPRQHRWSGLISTPLPVDLTGAGSRQWWISAGATRLIFSAASYSTRPHGSGSAIAYSCQWQLAERLYSSTPLDTPADIWAVRQLTPFATCNQNSRFRTVVVFLLIFRVPWVTISWTFRWSLRLQANRTQERRSRTSRSPP